MPGFAPGEVGLVKADGSGKTVNLTESGFEDRPAKWILGGQAMIWFSNRDGLKAAAKSGGAQNDVYALFFTRDAYDRFRLTKEEAALLKEIEEKKTKPEAPKDKKEPAEKEKKEEVKPLVIDWSGLALRKARLTIHSSSLGDALVNKDGDTLYYLARFEKGMNLWTTNLKTRETKMLVGAQRQRRPDGLGQGAEVDLPARRRRPVQDRPLERQARHDRHQGRDDRRPRRRARGPVRARLAPDRSRRSTGPAITAPTGTPSSRSTRSTSAASATTTTSPSS